MNPIQFSAPAPAMFKPQARGHVTFSPQTQLQADQVSIRFGAGKDPKAQALQQARIDSARILGVATDGKTVDREALGQAFINAWFQWLSEALADVEIECREPGYLNQTMSDVNMSESDFCSNEGLLDYALPDQYLDGEISYMDVLGYASKEEYKASYAEFLKPIAVKLGITDPNPTEKTVFAKMEIMSAEELAQRFPKDKTPKAPPSPPPIKKMMMKKAIFTVAKAAPPAKASPPKAAPHPFKGKTFVLTGTLSGMTRDEAKAKIEAAGGTVVSSVTKNTDFIVVGDKPGSKVAEAQKKGVIQFDEETFLKNLG